MKKRFIFFTLLLLTLIGGAKFNVLNAQETITIGGNASGTSQNYPMGLYYPYTLTQQIYTSSDINYGTGVISEIAFKINKSNATRNVTIYMKNTDKSVLSGLEPYSQSDKVFHSDNLVIAATENDGWMTIDLDTDFLYEGQNIVVSVLDNTGSYTSWNSNLLYKEDGFSSGITYYGYNSSSPITEGNQPTVYWGPSTSRGSVRFTISPASASVKVSAESIALGDVRLGNDWTEKNASANVEIKATATTITSISCDNDFFTLNYDLNQNPVALNVSYNKEANVSGAKSGDITITSADCDPVVISVTATAYIPTDGDGDVVATAIEVAFNENAYTHTATGMHDDYILPGEAEDGDLNDAVYQFTLANDAVVTANVNGTNAIAAIYDEDFDGEDGPSSYNNNTGVQSGPSAPTTFFYDFNDGDLSDFTLIDADIDKRNWEIQSNRIASYSWISGQPQIVPDNYIYTTKVYAITKNSKLTYKVCGAGVGQYYQDKYSVVISEDGENFYNVYTDVVNSSTPIEKEIELSEHAGKVVHIGLRHYDCTNMYYVAIDDLALTDGSAKSRAGENQIDGVQYPAGIYYLVAAAEGDFTLNLSTASLPAPESFAYTSPEDNTIVQETNPELSWGSARYASSYDVYLGTTTPLTKVASDITATSFQTEDLSNNTKYYWQVVAKNSKGETEGEVYSFVTPLDIPQNVTASSNEIYPDNNNVTITWNAINGVKGYNVYLKVNGGGNGIKHNGELVTAPSYALKNMDYSLNGHVVYVTAVYDIDDVTYESNESAEQTIKVTGYGEINGTITDAENSNGIDGVNITVIGTDQFGEPANYTTTTDENGAYSIANVLAGTYSLTASRLDYKTYTNSSIEVQYNVGYNGSFSLEPNPSAPFAVNAEEGSANWWDAEYASYNVYRRDSNGNVTSLATGVKEEEYQDADWERLADGEYEYGVSAMVDSPAEIMREGFDNGLPNGWNNPGNYINSGYRYWSLYGGSAYCYGYGTYYTMSLSTSVIDLRETSVSSLTFDYMNYPYSSSYGNNTLYVKVKAEGESYWTTVQTISTNVQTYTPCEVTLNNYVGKKIQISFDCYTSQYAYTYIDNVVVNGTTLEESRINWSAPVEKGGITFTGDGNWNTAANWNRVPESTDKVTIKGNATITEDVTVGSIRIASGATLTVKEGVVLNVTNGIINTNAAALVMEDGAQIIQTNSNVAATFNMDIVNPTQGWGENKDGWQFIASPLLNAKTSAFETSGENNDFDLYKYDGTQVGAEWVNYESHKRVGDTFVHNFNDGSLNGWTNLDATYQWNIATGGIDATNCLTSANSGTSYIMSPRVFVEEGSKFYFTAKSAYDQNIVVAVSETGSIDDMVTELNVSIGTSNWQYQDERSISLDEYAGKEIYIIIKTTSVFNGYATMSIDNLRLTNAGGASDGTFETEFVNGRAYLASYQAKTTATFTGVLNNATSFIKEFSYNDANNGDNLANFYLLGNPFTFDMDINNASFTDMVNGIAVVTSQGGYDYTQTTVPVGNGFFVQSTGNNASLSYTHNVRNSQETANSINVIASGKAGKDNVVVNFAGQSEGFKKLQNFNDAIATVYVSENGKNYGIANVDENTTEVALNFDAKEMGSYTISLDVNGEFETVTLVDRFTGVETNMLLEDEYTFTATGNDNVNRFVIRLGNGQEPTANSQFVYQSGEELILSIEGSVQIVDMLGRVVYSNEHSDAYNRINVSEFNDATYVVRVVNEEGVKVQKVVIY